MDEQTARREDPAAACRPDGRDGAAPAAAGAGGPVRVLCGEPALVAGLPLDLRRTTSLLTALWQAARGLAKEGLLAGVPARICLALMTDRDIAELNRRALGCPGPTNILSFPGAGYDDEADLALSVETLGRESLLYGQEPQEHLVRLLAHGLLHVCGLDHGRAMDAAQQELEEVGNLLVAGWLGQDRARSTWIF